MRNEKQVAERPAFLLELRFQSRLLLSHISFLTSLHHLVNEANRQTDHIPVIAFDSLDKQRRLRLNGVASGLIKRVALLDQKIDLRFRHLRKLHTSPLQPNLGSTVFRNSYSGQHLVPVTR